MSRKNRIYEEENRGNLADPKELELDDDRIERIDEVYNATMEFCRILTEDESLEWDMAYLGEIADLGAAILKENGKKVRFPSVVTKADGKQYIEDYV